MPITHAFTSAKKDREDTSKVRATEWNAAHSITLDSYTDGSSKLIKSGNNWEIWTNGVRVAFIDASGNLHIKGVIITEDGSV